MIVGKLLASGEAAVQITVRGPAGEMGVWAVIDTGFDGWLSLPSEQIRRLGLSPMGDVEVELADGRVQNTNIYEAMVLWNGAPRLITVDEAPTEPLLGTEMLWGYELRIRYAEDGRVEIEAVP